LGSYAFGFTLQFRFICLSIPYIGFIYLVAGWVIPSLDIFQFPILGSQIEVEGRYIALKYSFNSLYWVLCNTIPAIKSMAGNTFNSLYWVHRGRKNKSLYHTWRTFNSLYWVRDGSCTTETYTIEESFNSLYWVLTSS